MNKVAMTQKTADGTSPQKAVQPSNALAVEKAKLAELRLAPVEELYFDMSLGSIYESCNLDDISIPCYMRAIKIDLIYGHHPDKAFPFMGLGSVMYHIDEPAWALRCFLKAREIREATLGGDCVDTATVYNNLGCCMFMLERNEEAKAYFQLSNAIFDHELGPNHERTITVSTHF